ncbi:MAG: helix-turn-helix transcriptional regulator [Candidatus Sericytochromatia bacterium]|nr:helix-turn-helix transcriptional regulator [Candidatus Sericytochromatia bacterium]
MSTETDNPLGPRARHILDKQGRIRTVARRLFTERGYAGTTIDQIAKEADVAKGTVFI